MNLKQKACRASGKSWAELYPDEPETTFLGDEDVPNVDLVAPVRMMTPTLSPSESALAAAQAWSEKIKAHGHFTQPHTSVPAHALAFELL